MKVYVINFFVWWYGVRVRDFGERIVQLAIFVLDYTNTLVMARNLFVPLFQDDSGIGKMIAVIVRGTWVWFGGMISLVFIIPLLMVLLLYALLPVIAIVQIILGALFVVI